MKRTIVIVAAFLAMALGTTQMAGCAWQAKKDLDAANQQLDQTKEDALASDARASAMDQAVGHIQANFGGVPELITQLESLLPDADPLIDFVRSLQGTGLTTREIINKVQTAVGNEQQQAQVNIQLATQNVADAEAAYEAAVQNDLDLIELGGVLGSIGAPGIAGGIATVLGTGYATYWAGKRKGKVQVAKIMRDGVRGLREEVPGVTEALTEGKTGEFFRVIMDNDELIERVVTRNDRHKPRRKPKIDPNGGDAVSDAVLMATTGRAIRSVSGVAGNTLTSDPAMDHRGH